MLLIIYALPQIKLLNCLCYPERNFGGNQLLDGSISLSPLHSSLTNDLHVSTVSDLQQEFLPASSYPSVVHHLSGPNRYARSQHVLPEAHDRPMLHLAIGTAYFHCSCMVYKHQHNRVFVRLLVPCFKTGR